ncbi:UNVERIFIED_ORG: hypothetical protein LHJ69_23575 [Shinella sp. XGS7]|nr:hypothetical protein [Shinella sp. XGS7]
MFLLRSVKTLACLAPLALTALSGYAEPTSGPVTISQIRPYIGSTTVYVYTNDLGPCGQQVGSRAIYSIDLASPAGKAAYAAALAATAAGKLVLLEVIAGACGGEYPGLQSIYFRP